MPAPLAPPDLNSWDAIRSVVRWVYAERRLALPLSPQHVTYMQVKLGLKPEDVPDEMADETIKSYGLDSYLCDVDCGSPGVWPGLRFDRLRSQFCVHEVEARRTGVWPQAASKEQADFDRAYHARVMARREGRDPGVFFAFTHGPHHHSSASDDARRPDEEGAPF